MKTIIALLTTTVLVAGATTAMADQQRSDEAAGYALSLQGARGGFGGAYASARTPGVAHSVTINATANGDFQAQGR